ncbi:hypothetical protein QEZ54_25310 [Catellatospora sp. KI3]|uniref:hypothetical protein n=1 Tax=Catellatospora sp. KI3 TaxID=3041620 RepID=UPI0024827D71|nr:hypothetical protein [Catellatospora sp. KI3]MDI1464294.1 hypothetical protein [Catellatospora sp. KI3]
MFATRRAKWVTLTVVLAAVIAWTVLALLLDRDAYGAMTDGVQAVGVVAALGLAAATLLRDNRDRRVDRALALHQELSTGDLWQARQRLVTHLTRLDAEQRKEGDPERVRRVTREQLRSDPRASVYADGIGSPRIDADLLVRFFERAEAARRTHALDVPLFGELIGRQAVWWNTALIADGRTWTCRRSLTELAAWASAAGPYAPGGRNLGLESAVRDFGPEHGAPAAVGD